MLANKLRARASNPRFATICDRQGNPKHQPKHIADCFADYYNSLYNLTSDNETHQPTNRYISTFLQEVHLPQLTEDLHQTLAAPISLFELTSAIKGLPNGKAPGPDGFMAHYYKSFPELYPKLLLFFQSIFKYGQPPKDWLSAHIVTLPKMVPPSSQCSQYRPISLLNVDTKLYAKILANRLSEVLPLLISDNQVGFIKNRQGADNTLKVLLIVDHAVQVSQPILLLSLDAEKAFDWVNWSFLLHTQNKFGFPGTLISAIKGLYTHPSARVLNAGFASDPISITNGMRQGCPLSPLLYALVL
uniref:Reverse transcriptase domain-containing protein n=1 Tax=Leptobrachium leishanense TaxID=445787 RepID=A0A8C5Q6A3_9ANUR